MELVPKPAARGRPGAADRYCFRTTAG